MKCGEAYPLYAPPNLMTCSICIEEYSGFGGPATVRMVSNNGPPLPMPMQVPPGHMVQQIVDEHGILTHVILSPQPVHGGPMTGGPNSATQYYHNPYGPHYPAHPQYPAHHHPHPHAVPPHIHTNMPPHVPTPPPHSCSNHAPVQHSGPSPPLNSTEDRTLRQRARARKKLDRRRTSNNNNNDSSGFYGRPNRRRGPGVNGDVHHGNNVSNAMAPAENGPAEVEEDHSLLVQALSTLAPPRVTDIEPRYALIQLTPPDLDTTELEVENYELKYELLVSDKGRDGKYKTVYSGEALEITLQDLKPATEYFIKVCCVMNDEVRGNCTETVSFKTAACEPDAPSPPKFASKTKTSITLKWNSTCENGSKLSTYTLECDQGRGDGNFTEIYNGLQRQFRATKLNASTKYTFRLAAINNVGKSPYSEPVSFFTTGSTPSPPDPPMLSEQFVFALTLSWIRRPNDDDFSLQMDDEPSGHGFMTVYNGPNLSYTIRNLRRNSEYKFRLGARNEEGTSKYSDAVAYRTLPDRPCPPCKPQIKGKIQAHSFRVTWEPPSDTGGSEITKYFVELDDRQGYETVYEGSEREHCFDHLKPGHEYKVRVACCSVGGRSEFSDVVTATTQPVTPGQCQPPKLQGKPKATSLHLRWSYPDYDGGCQVTAFAAQMISPDNSTREVYHGHDLDCIVAGLLPGRPYLFQVRALNRIGGGPWSEPLEVVSGAGIPDPPKAPQVHCKSPHSALISWEQPINNGAAVTEYRLEWQQRNEVNDFTQLYLGPNLSYEVKALTPATLYTFRVQAVNSAGPGLYSAYTQCTTPPSSPAPVVSVRAVPFATSIALTWRQPHNNGSDIVAYNIDLGERQISIGPTTEYTIEGLQPETVYKIRIQAENSIGVGAFSSVYKVTTRALPPSPPRLECVAAAPNSLKLKWGDGRNPDLVTFTLEMEKEDGSFLAVYEGHGHTHKVTRLSELTNYEFRIFARNEAGCGPCTETYTFSTTKAPPPALKAPKAHSFTQAGCLLEWQGCRPMGSDAILYVLQVQSLDSSNNEYRQVYRGPGTQFRLEDMRPRVEYQARVCAVRQCQGEGGEVLGAFSPGTNFALPSPEPPRPAIATQRALPDTAPAEPRPWTEKQLGFILLLGFAAVSCLVALIAPLFFNFNSDASKSN